MAQISMVVLWHRPAPICEGKGLLSMAMAKHRLALPWHRLVKVRAGFAMSSVGIDWLGNSLLHIDYAQRRGAKALRREDLRRKEMQRHRAAAPGVALQRLGKAKKRNAQ
jgi:hypothetical protein